MAAYHRPDTLAEALQILGQTPEITIAAGCTDLFPATAARALPGPVLDVTGIAECRGIDAGASGVRIGGAATWTEVIRAPLPPAFDMLKEAAREVGSVQIQNAGTVAGNLCNASPAADGVPCLLALEASVELASAGERRLLALQDFLTGPRKTALAPGEILAAVRIPAAATAGRSRFLKLGARRYLVISIAMAAARLVAEDGRISEAAVAVGACGPVASRLAELEAALKGAPLADASALVTRDLVGTALSPIDDIRADAGYRIDAATELVRRALADLGAAEARAA